MGYHPDYVRLDGERFVPSANQGTIIVVAKAGSEAEACSRALDDAHARSETMIERKIMETVGGGCVVPMAVHALVQKGEARVLAEVLSPDGKRFVRLEERISLVQNHLAVAEDMGERLMRMGGRELVDEAVRFFGNR